MARIIDYGVDTEEARARALADCQDWLADDYYRITGLIGKALQAGEKSQRIIMALCMQGIEGYPAQVLVEHVAQCLPGDAA